MTEHRGIDPELVPYLDEVDTPKTEDNAEKITSGEAEMILDDERHQELTKLINSVLLAGPDPQLAAEITNGEYGEEIEETEETNPQPGGALWDHEKLLDKVSAELAQKEQIKEIFNQICARAPEHKVQPSLERIKALCQLLGNPEAACPLIHVGGTNGKTSTTRMIESLAGAHNLRTGRFTSPHLHTVRERIAIDTEPIAAQTFISTWEDILPYVEMVDAQRTDIDSVKLSFFEVLTAMAFAAFADAPIDLGVIEVGMGGTWDATNVIDAKICVITPISRDHTNWLGHTIEEIATEKAGIIKANSTLILAPQPEGAREIILAAAAEKNCLVRESGTDFEVLSTELAVGGQLVSIRTPAGHYTDLYLPLHGAHQAQNAALALVAMETFFGGATLNGDLVQEGFAGVTSPGRLEIVRSSPMVIVDAAHNPGGAQVMCQALTESFRLEHIVGVFSAMGDKDIEAILSECEPYLDSIVITSIDSDRASDIDEIEQCAKEVFGSERVSIAPQLIDAVETAATLVEEYESPAGTCTVVVFGSVVLAGAARELFGKN